MLSLNAHSKLSRDAAAAGGGGQTWLGRPILRCSMKGNTALANRLARNLIETLPMRAAVPVHRLGMDSLAGQARPAATRRPGAATKICPVFKPPAARNGQTLGNSQAVMPRRTKELFTSSCGPIRLMPELGRHLVAGF